VGVSSDVDPSPPPSHSNTWRMFQFNFDLEGAGTEDEEILGIFAGTGTGGEDREEGTEAKEHACTEISLQELVSVQTRAIVS
jgi:hypothetical protein